MQVFNQLKVSAVQKAWDSNLSVLHASLGATDDTLRREETLQEFHLVKRDVGAEGP